MLGARAARPPLEQERDGVALVIEEHDGQAVCALELRAVEFVGMLMAGPNRVRVVEALVFRRQSC